MPRRLEILTTYPQAWMRIETFRLLLRETGAALPPTTAIQACLKTRGNLARLLDIQALARKPLPQPALPRKRAGLAVNEMV